MGKKLKRVSVAVIANLATRVCAETGAHIQCTMHAGAGRQRSPVPFAESGSEKAASPAWSLQARLQCHPGGAMADQTER